MVVSIRRFRGYAGRILVLMPVLSLASLLLMPSVCQAYVDPNAAGWLFQALFPIFVAIGGAWAVFRRRIAAIFQRVRRALTRNKGLDVV